ncbi:MULTISPECIES: PAAR-like domain-containing protein [Burkholderia]|uniref:PAAR-like domain-containing protein n=1 Tax=Burkholderia TaxID=32008 RepID=UPI000763D336|nr:MULTISPECIES: PAAR-like domain-containing protein [Burkholderia]KVG80376.1 type VI secretion protein [Burkholderia sp. MSMB2040]KWZ46375.1 type VI secretion protein [Burkholderia savannae]
MVMVNSSAGGENMATSVNLTPPAGAPAPYPNRASRASAIPNVTNIFVGGGPAHNVATIIPMSSGDSAGAMGGAASGTVSSVSRNARGASKTLIAGMPATRMTDPTQQNSGNTIGAGSSPSQTIVLNLSG